MIKNQSRRGFNFTTHWKYEFRCWMTTTIIRSINAALLLGVDNSSHLDDNNDMRLDALVSRSFRFRL